MADGRLFTDYRSRCDINYLPASSGSGAPIPADSYAYRQYLISHADDLIAAARKNAYSVAACAPCVRPSTMLPEKQTEVCDSRTCVIVPGPDPVNGLGMGRAYGGTGANADQTRAQAEQDRTAVSAANCCSSPFDIANYYADGTSMLRLTSPGGASGSPLQGGDPSTAPVPFQR